MNTLATLKAHVDLCQECKRNPFGLCPRGFALIGVASKMRDSDSQKEFESIVRESQITEKPMVRIFLGNGPKR